METIIKRKLTPSEMATAFLDSRVKNFRYNKLISIPDINSKDTTKYLFAIVIRHFEDQTADEVFSEIRNNSAKIVNYDKDTLMNKNSGILYDKLTYKVVGIHNT